MEPLLVTCNLLVVYISSADCLGKLNHAPKVCANFVDRLTSALQKHRKIIYDTCTFKL